jgi:hypothetical protein
MAAAYAQQLQLECCGELLAEKSAFSAQFMA